MAPIPDNRNWDISYSSENLKTKRRFPTADKTPWIFLTLDEVYSDIEKTYQKIKKKEAYDEKIGI